MVPCPGNLIRLPGDLPFIIRLACAGVGNSWNLNMWRNAMFSNESRFCLKRLDQRVKLWRRCRECFSNCTDNIKSFGGGSVMAWGGISLTGEMRLVIIGYREILRPNSANSGNPKCPQSGIKLYPLRWQHLPPQRVLSETTSRIWEWRGWNGLSAVLASTPLNTCGISWSMLLTPERLTQGK